MKWFITLTLTCLYTAPYAQAHELVKAISSDDLDGVEIAIYKVATKEMVPPDGEPFEKLMIQKKVSHQEIRALLKRASRRSSYNDSRALLSHWNVVITFSSNENKITLSTLTGNISVTQNGTTSYGHISNKFGKHLYRFLQDADLLKYMDEEDLEAIEAVKQY